MPDFRADVRVMLKPSILDPQGRAVETTLKRLGHEGVRELRVGKVITLTLSGERAEVERELQAMIHNVLSNPVMEDASFTLRELGPGNAP